MALLKVTERGQITLNKAVLQHLGVEPGGKLELNLIPGHKGFLEAAKPGSDWASVAGMLMGKGNSRVLSIVELDNAIAKSGAEAGTDVED